MDIGSAGAASLSSVNTSAVAGLQKTAARVAGGAEQLAAGNLDPAVVVDITAAQTDFAANVAVLKTSDAMSKRLLDMLA